MSFCQSDKTTLFADADRTDVMAALPIAHPLPLSSSRDPQPPLRASWAHPSPSRRHRSPNDPVPQISVTHSTISSRAVCISGAVRSSASLESRISARGNRLVKGPKSRWRSGARPQPAKPAQTEIGPDSRLRRVIFALSLCFPSSTSAHLIA